MVKIDLHTHSEASRDGGITAKQYAKLLEDEMLDVIAITDHDRIDFAEKLQKTLGEKYIIVGEEITTTQGEIIGLYLQEKIKPGMSAKDTIKAIKAQNGLVYIPHPFEKVRSGIQQDILETLLVDIDIIEGYNGRAITQTYGRVATEIAKKHSIAIAASSDAHTVKGVGMTYTALLNHPKKSTLVSELLNGKTVYGRPPLHTLLYPKYNRIKNSIKRTT